MKSETTQKPSWQFEAFGTTWEIESEKEITAELRSSVTALLDDFDAAYSRFRDDSIVSKMSMKKGKYTFPDTAPALFAFYEELFSVTGGKVTPLVGDTLVSAGYDERYSLSPQPEISQVKSYDEIIQRSGATINLKEPTMIDVGAAGKGYAVDLVGALVQGAGHDTFTIDASGDLRSFGWVEEVVGLENPLNTEEVIGFVTIENQALCASGVNRRAWGEWHHIIDPTTSRPATDVIATWVIAKTTMLADGLATALFFVSPQKLATKYNYEYLRMYADGSVEYSDYFGEGLFE